MMTLSAAWRIILPEIMARTVDVWSNTDYAENPDFLQIAADVEAGNMSQRVLNELMDFYADLTGNLWQAAIVVLATNDRLELFDPAAIYTKKPKTRTVNGKVYVV